MKNSADILNKQDEMIDRIILSLMRLKVSRIIFYGYAKKSHTHYWVMAAMHKAMCFAVRNNPEFEVLWFDNDVKFAINQFRNAVVFSNINSDFVDIKMPLIDSSFYIVHDHGNFISKKSYYHNWIKAGRCTINRVFRGRPDKGFEGIESEPNIHLKSLSKATMLITWATDLLPFEIKKNINNIRKNTKKEIKNKDVVFVGSVWVSNESQLIELAEEVSKRGLLFKQFGRQLTKGFIEHNFVKKNSVDIYPNSVSNQYNKELIASAYIAPAVQGLQLKNDQATGNYIPCRIFKNISYGAYGVTNNQAVVDLFRAKIAYGSTLGGMLQSAEDIMQADVDNDLLYRQMKEVACSHTYLNRIAMLLEFSCEKNESVFSRQYLFSDNKLFIFIRRIKYGHITLKKITTRVKRLIFNTSS